MSVSSPSSKPFTSPAPHRRVLLVSYFFEPGAGTGAYRWNAFTKKLSETRWTIDVLTVHRPYWCDAGEACEEAPVSHRPGIAVYPISEEWWGQQFREGIRWGVDAIRSQLLDWSQDPSSEEPVEASVWSEDESRGLWKRLRRDLNGVGAIASEWIWTYRAQRVARRLAQCHSYTGVVVTSPKYLPQLVGADLVERHDFWHLADFRDIWYYGRGVLKSYWDDARRVIGRIAEPRSLVRANPIVHVTERARDAHSAALSTDSTPNRFYVPNGCEPLDQIHQPDPDCFRVVYTGWIYEHTDIRPVLAACGRFQRRHDLSPSAFKVQFMGTPRRFGGVVLSELAAKHDIGPYFERFNRRPREEDTALQQDAAVMVAIDQPHGLQVPSKLFHCAQMKGALLLVGNTKGAMADEATKIGESVLALDDDAGMDRVLDDAYAQWQAGTFTEPIDAEGRFSIHRSSERMRGLLGERPDVRFFNPTPEDLATELVRMARDGWVPPLRPLTERSWENEVHRYRDVYATAVQWQYTTA